MYLCNQPSLCQLYCCAYLWTTSVRLSVCVCVCVVFWAAQELSTCCPGLHPVELTLLLLTQPFDFISRELHCVSRQTDANNSNVMNSSCELTPFPPATAFPSGENTSCMTWSLTSKTPHPKQLLVNCVVEFHASSWAITGASACQEVVAIFKQIK